MRKFYSLLILAVLSVFAAKAVTITFNVDADGRVMVAYPDASYNTVIDTLKAGDNSIDFGNIDADYGKHIRILTTDTDFGISSMMNLADSSEVTIYGGNSTDFSIYPANDGQKYEIKTFSYNDQRTNSCYVVIDHPERILLRRATTNTEIEFTDSITEVKFMDSEVPFKISGTYDYSTYSQYEIYQVVLKGEAIAGSYGEYEVAPASGDTIFVICDFPDVQVPVHFTYTLDNPECMDYVLVDGDTVTNYNDADFTVQLGAKIDICVNYSNYHTDSIFVNGAMYSTWNTATITIKEETTIEIKATPYGQTTFSITVDDPSHVNVYPGYYNYDLQFDLVAGKNEVSMSSRYAYISYSAADGYEVTSVTVNGVETVETDDYYISVSDSADVVFTTAEEGTVVADSVMVYFDVDHADRITMSYSDAEWVEHTPELVDGLNAVNLGILPEWGCYLYIDANDGYGIESVVNTLTGDSAYIYSGNSANVSIRESHNGQTFQIKTYSIDEARTDSCFIIVDHAEKVQIMRSMTNTYPTLVDGENVVKYMASEVPFWISGKYDSSIGATSKIYQILHNGELVVASYGSYSVTPACGDTITVITEFPDIQVPVFFTFTNEGTEGAISYITVNNVERAISGDSIMVQVGSSVYIKGNTNDYSISSITVNGSILSYYGYGSFDVMDTARVEITATAYEQVPVYVTIDHPENITIYHGSSWSGTLLTLAEGRNELSLSTKTSYLTYSVTSGHVLKCITLNGDTVTDNSSIYFNAGDEIVFETGDLERNETAVIFIDDVTAPTQYITVSMGYSSWYLYDWYDGITEPTTEIGSGYNVIKFNSSVDNPFSISGYGNIENRVFYLNDVITTGSNYFEANLADGDVVKAYLLGEPASYAVTFTGNIDAEGVSVTRDKIVAVSDLAAGFTALAQTEVSVSAAGATVLVNNEPAEANEEGNVIFVVNADTQVDIAMTTGIHSVRAARAADGNVYNAQGMLIMRGADDTSKLPAGIYIINGKKVVK